MLKNAVSLAICQHAHYTTDGYLYELLNTYKTEHTQVQNNDKLHGHNCGYVYEFRVNRLIYHHSLHYIKNNKLLWSCLCSKQACSNITIGKPYL